MDTRPPPLTLQVPPQASWLPGQVRCQDKRRAGFCPLLALFLTGRKKTRTAGGGRSSQAGKTSPNGEVSQLLPYSLINEAISSPTHRKRPSPEEDTAGSCSFYFSYLEAGQTPLCPLYPMFCHPVPLGHLTTGLVKRPGHPVPLQCWTLLLLCFLGAPLSGLRGHLCWFLFYPICDFLLLFFLPPYSPFPLAARVTT